MRPPDMRSDPETPFRRIVIGGMVATELVFISQLSSAASLSGFQTIGLWLFVATLPWFVVRLSWMADDYTIVAPAVNRSERLKGLDTCAVYLGALGVGLMLAHFNPWMGVVAAAWAAGSYFLTQYVGKKGAGL